MSCYVGGEKQRRNPADPIRARLTRSNCKIGSRSRVITGKLITIFVRGLPSLEENITLLGTKIPLYNSWYRTVAVGLSGYIESTRYISRLWLDKGKCFSVWYFANHQIAEFIEYCAKLVVCWTPVQHLWSYKDRS